MSIRGQKGISMIEVIITTGIIVMLTGALIVQVRASSPSRAIQTDLYLTLLSIRKAQALTASTTTGSGGVPPNGYGMFVTISTTDPRLVPTYTANSRLVVTIFSDNNGNKIFDSGEVVEVRPLQAGTQVQNLFMCTAPSATATPCSTFGLATDLTMYFCPPNPNTFLFGTATTDDLRNGSTANCANPIPPNEGRSALRVRFFPLSPGTLPTSTPRCIEVNAEGAAFVRTGLPLVGCP